MVLRAIARPSLVCALALGVPLALRAWVQAGVADVETAAAARVPGVEVAIGSIEADLTGTLRLADVQVGEWLTARSLEGSLGASSILSGRLRADEVRVAHPRVRLALGDDGRLRLPFARREGKGGGKGDAQAKRIVVTEGVLEIAVGDTALVRASGVELHPTTSGVRAVTGEVVITATSGGVAGEAHFERAGVDVDLPGGRIRRAVASAGTLTVARGEERFRLGDLVVQHGVEAGQTRIDGRANGETVSVSLARSEGGALAIEAKLPALPVGLVPDGIRPPWVLPAGTLGGALQAHRQAGVWDVAVDLHGQGVELAHELLATEPVRVGAVEIAATATWDRERHEGRVSGALTHERVTVEIDGALGETGAEVTARLARVPCQALLVALPDAIKAPLAGLALDGTIGAEVKATAPRTAEAELTIGMDFGCRALAEAAGKDPRDLLGGDAYPHRLPDGQERRFGRRDADFVALDHLPRHVAAAFVSAEDGRFFSHRGIDPIELGRSFAADVAVRKPVRGGSTLTQQLAKNLWLGRDRTVGRKLVEAVLAWRLESVVGKRRILEIYLSVIELGEGVWGVAQGSRRWFDLPPARLSVTQAAFLAAITPEPRSAEKRIREAGKLDPRTRDRVRIILGAMKKDRAIDRETYERALGELARLRVEVGDLRKASR